MKFITYDASEGSGLGAIVGDYVINLREASHGSLPTDMRSFLEMGDDGMDSARAAIEQASASGPKIPLDNVRIMAPILNPSKIVAIGLNYWDHCREQNIEPPKAPIIFTKFSSSIIGPDDTIRWDPSLTNQVDYEAELAVVMGRRAKNIKAEVALDYVAGYTICNDVSARELQRGDRQWIRGKSLDTFCPLGPCLVTKDEIADPHNLAIRCIVNDDVRQDSNTSEMIFRIPYLIEYMSRAFTFLPGDIIITGTPDGVGLFRSPQIFLKDGDTVRVEIEKLGQLTNLCAAV